MIPVFLANGFEEIEALAAVDLLRRAGVEVVTVGVGSKMPVGAHNITVSADIGEDELKLDTIDGVVLPGGMPGTTNLEASAVVQKAVAYAAERD
ncbi:MAG: DJ-1/PfpI family protein, partial [Clostridia bacterium]|nr:DJ-1/PfpI family protein [Clostridia bacterium]